MDYRAGAPSGPGEKFEMEALRLEYVTTCVGFDDMLDVTLALNNPHFDTAIVVTSYDDHKTHNVCRKHGAICVPTDLFKKNGRNFNKGAAINDGFNRFQYWGWRAHMDCDIVVPDNFRRLLFNHSTIDRHCLYGADRIDVLGLPALAKISKNPQHWYSTFLMTDRGGPVSPRYVNTLHGYVPIGFFQLWHSSCQKPYPYSLGTAAHDDVMFSTLWPKECRRILPTAVMFHLVSEPATLGQNWDGRKSKRLK